MHQFNMNEKKCTKFERYKKRFAFFKPYDYFKGVNLKVLYIKYCLNMDMEQL